MRALVVYCHPVPESFCAALRDETLSALQRAGHETRLIDLYAEGFDPVMGADERRRYNDLPSPPSPLPEHAAHLAWADMLVFVYPTWWYGLPAMLKGWFDRALAPGVAFSLDPATLAIRPGLAHVRRLVVVTTCGAPLWWSHVVGHPGRRTIMRGIRALCAPRCRTLFLVHYRMDASTDASRKAFLAKVGARLSRP